LLICAGIDADWAEPIAAGKITVIDGNTIDARGQRWRLVGYDTPEISSSARQVSPVESMVGKSAAERLEELLRSDRLDLIGVRCPCSAITINPKACFNGYKCGLLARNGKNIGAQLIRDKLAVKFSCGRSSCPPKPDWAGISIRKKTSAAKRAGGKSAP
jgi:endonuclease YncB( thermonuclease family)